jgi:hypothetical protein
MGLWTHAVSLSDGMDRARGGRMRARTQRLDVAPAQGLASTTDDGSGGGGRARRQARRYACCGCEHASEF